MRRLRSWTVAATLVALAFGAFGSPVGAADTKGTLAIVNGRPGGKVDVCINGREVRSRLRYGQVWKKGVVAVGKKTLKFYKPDPRRCRGKLLAQKKVQLGPAADLTLVVTKRKPKVVVFDNLYLGMIPPLGLPTNDMPFAIRHAAERPADLSFDYWRPPPINNPVSPNGIFTKGQEDWGFFRFDYAIEARATFVGSAVSIRATMKRAVPNRRVEWILVGTKRANARWVIIDRRVSRPIPL